MDKEKRANIMMGVVITIMVLLAIIVVVFIYLGAVFGSMGARINNALDDLKKKFGKLTTVLGEVGDEIADGIKDVVIPAFKQIGPEVKGVVTSSVNLLKGYLTLGKGVIDYKTAEVQSEVQAMASGQIPPQLQQQLSQKPYQPAQTYPAPQPVC